MTNLKSNNMKNFILLVTSFLLISVSACSQNNLPENVKKEFAQKYPSAQSVKWDSESPGEWEAEFRLEGKKMSACFDNSAKWLESETEISEKELPAEVLNTLNSEFQGYKKSSIEIIENPEMKGFELALKKGESSMEVVFDNSGKIIRKTEAKEEDEKDEKTEEDKD
jgi:outer membrane lipoprotein-sorting protein